MTLDIPPAWAELADRLAPSAWGRLIVLGGTDVGKSSFLRFLARVLVRRGQTVALLDTDLGQKMVGPPACLRCSRPLHPRRRVADGAHLLRR